MDPRLVITDHRKGVVIAATGGFLLAWDIPLILLAQTDPWTALSIRGPAMFIVMYAVYYFLTRNRLTNAKFIDGQATVVLGILHAVATIAFVLGIYYTTTANLVFIVALSSLIAIILSTVIFKECYPVLTWMTILVALCGIAVITFDDFDAHGNNNIFGNLMALLCAVVLALEVMFIRSSGKNLVFAPALAGLIAAAFSLPLAIGYGFQLGEPIYFLFNAIFISPIAMALMSLAPRYISAPETAMFYLLETVFAPILVWIIFLERPSSKTLIGGLIIVSAIGFHSYRQIRYGRTKNAVIV